ncbi:MAG: GTPase ObgE [Chlamydiia bacterium]
MFVDFVTLTLEAGSGGPGVIAWRREKYIPKGGPVGGDGGRGGSVILEADDQVYSLEGFRNRRQMSARSGDAGGAACRQGRSGVDLILKVPCGTVVRDAQTKEVIQDIVHSGQRFIVCRGGKGGFGNHRFRSATQQAPYLCTPGEPGEAREIELELKLIADCGLVGFPNAGKSTLIQALTQISVKIAAYPFTTLRPNLGFIMGERGARVLVADIPGIIEGAHENRGLGFAFLKHIERTELLLYVLDAGGFEERDPAQDLATLEAELKAYRPDLLDKPSLIVLNKIDISDEVPAQFVAQYKGRWPIFLVSAQEGTGIQALRDYLLQHAAKVWSVPSPKAERETLVEEATREEQYEPEMSSDEL